MEGPQETPVATETVTGPSKRPLSDERLKVLAAARLKAAEVRKARSKERQDAKTLQAQEQAQMAELQRMEKAAKMLEVQRRTEELRRQMSPAKPEKRRLAPVDERSPAVDTGRLQVAADPLPPRSPPARQYIQSANDRLYAQLFGA